MERFLLQCLLIAWHLRRQCNDVRRTSLHSCNIWPTVTKYENIDYEMYLYEIIVAKYILFADKSNCVSASIAIIHPANEIKSVHGLHKNINTVAMLTHDLLLRHFREGMYNGRIGGCALLSLMYSCYKWSFISPSGQRPEGDMN